MDPLVFRLNPWVDLGESSPGERQFFSWFDHSVLLFLGNACNLRCAYCFKPTDTAGVEPVSEIEAQVRRAVQSGVSRAILTGGEPLLHPRLDEILAVLREHGLRTFGLQTNAVRLAAPDALERWVSAGLRFCHVSLDSPDAATEDTLAGRSGTFKQVMTALENVARHPEVTLHVKAVITSRNEDQIVPLVELFARSGERWGVDLALTLTPMVPPDGHYSDLLVRYDSVAPALHEGIEAGRRAGLRVYYHHVPYCLMGGFHRQSIDWFVQDSVLLEDGGSSDDTMYAKPDRCRSCEHCAVCRGFPTAYADLFGDDIFQSGKTARRAPALPPARPMRDRYALSARLVIGSLKDDAPSYWSLRSIKNRIQQIVDSRCERVVITGVDPLFHPALPVVVKELSEHGFEVWLETLGLGFSRRQPIDSLVACGLRGVRWLHLSPAAKPYLALLGKPLPPGFAARAGLLLARAGLAVEHVFLVGEEPPEMLRARIEALGRQPFERFTRSRIRLSSVPLTEKWSAWLGVEGHDGDALGSSGSIPAGVASMESNSSFRTIVPGPE